MVSLPQYLITPAFCENTPRLLLHDLTPGSLSISSLLASPTLASFSPDSSLRSRLKVS